MITAQIKLAHVIQILNVNQSLINAKVNVELTKHAGNHALLIKEIKMQKN
jgi:hypothetical protein